MRLKPTLESNGSCAHPTDLWKSNRSVGSAWSSGLVISQSIYRNEAPYWQTHRRIIAPDASQCTQKQYRKLFMAFLGLECSSVSSNNRVGGEVRSKVCQTKVVLPSHVLWTQKTVLFCRAQNCVPSGGCGSFLWFGSAMYLFTVNTCRYQRLRDQ